jgi:hypothetical protein
MTPLHLIAIDANFHWPGKLQSFVYRIYASRNGIRHREPSIQSLPSEQQGQMGRIKMNAEAWANRLFSDSGIINWNIKFEQSLDPQVYIHGGMAVVVNLQLHHMEFYNIIIHIDKDINECCDVHCRSGNWTMKGVNIFQIRYVDDIQIHGHNPHKHTNDTKVGLGSMSYMESPFKTHQGSQNGDRPIYIDFKSPALDRKSNGTYLTPEGEKPIPEESKSSKEFRELKEKITGMADTIRKEDTETF